MINVPCMPDEFAPGYEGRLARINIDRTTAALHSRIIRWHELVKGTPRVSALAVAAGLSAPDFIQRHTTLPCRQFISDPKDAGFRHGSPERFSSAKQLAMTPPDNRARSCRCCVEEDITFHGFSYWRRTHHLQGIDWCPKHHVLLTEIPAGEAFLCQPDEWLDEGCGVDSTTQMSECQVLQRLTEISVGALDFDGPVSSIQIARTLKRLLKDSGFRMARAGTRMLLSDCARERLPLPWLERHFPDVASKQALKHIATLDSVSRGRGLPLVHLAYLLAFALLCPSADEALRAIRSAQTETPAEPTPVAQKKYPRTFWRSPELRQIYTECEGKHRRVAARLGLSTSHVRIELPAVGLPALVELERSTLDGLLDFLRGTPLSAALIKHAAESSKVEFWLRQDLLTLRPLLEKQQADRCATA